MEEKSWMVDSGATRHICINRNSLISYNDMEEGEERIYVGDSKRVAVPGKGKVNLKLTFGKILSLNDVLYMPKMRYNLISISILGKASVKVIFENDEVVLTKSGNLVGKGHYVDGLFLLNVSYVIMKMHVLMFI